MAVAEIRPDYACANFDAGKIAPYTLEDPLRFADGTPVRNVDDWKKRRTEILEIFAKEMYGQEPPPPECIAWETVEEKCGVLAGFGVRSQYRMWFRKDRSGPCLDWLVIRPRFARKKVPVILFLNFHGNFQLLPDPEIVIPEMWTPFTKDHRLSPERGVMCRPDRNSVLPIGQILCAGYAVMSACYCQVSPDPEKPEENGFQKDFAFTGVFELWGKRERGREDDCTSLGAWAWALSRGLDLAERIPEIDAERCVVTGVSRLGKAALLAGARDERFAVCVPIQCGGGGATLAKRDFGENVATEMHMFPHWYCRAYRKYERNPAETLPFDQHLLLAALAPRKLLIGGFNDPWFDTEGEYLACRAAGPVWEFLGKPGLPGNAFPGNYDRSAIGPYLGYYRRTEQHGMADYDWRRLLKFAGEEEL